MNVRNPRRRAVLFLLAPCLQWAGAAPQGPSLPQLDTLANGRDGLPYAGVGPVNALSDPESLRFWVGQGLTLSQIKIDNRERRFQEELDQPYVNEIIAVRFDETSASPADHRLYVLTERQTKSDPVRPNTLYLLGAENPASTEEIHSVNITDTLSVGTDPVYDYSISDICLIPGTDLIVAVGGAQLPGNPSSRQLLVILFERQIVQPGNQEQLVRIAEVRRPPLELNNITGLPSPRYLKGLSTAHVQNLNGELALLATGLVDPLGRGVAGLAFASLDPTNTDPAQRVQWIDDKKHVFDPLYWQYVLRNPSLPGNEQLPLPPPANDFTVVSANDVVVVEEPGSASTDPSEYFAYVASGKYLQLVRVDVTDVLATGGLDYETDLEQFAIEPQWTPGASQGVQSSQNFQNFYWIDSFKEQGADLLFTTGSNALYALMRDDPDDFGRVYQKFNDPPVGGHLMRENLGAGNRYHLWTVCYDTPSPLSIFDVTDRLLLPGILDPTLLSRHYLPGGTDGAVFIPELDNAVDATNFGGLVRYEASFDLGAGTGFVQPVPESYQPAMVHTNEFVTEQLEVAHFGGDEYVLMAPNGRGGATLWPVDPTSKDPYNAVWFNPEWASFGPSDNVYSLRAAFAYSAARERHFALFDAAVRNGGTNDDELYLGRFTQVPEGTPFAMLNASNWEELDLRTQDLASPEGLGLLGSPMTDVAISPDARWAFVGCQNGMVVVELHDGVGDDTFAVADTWYSASAGLPILDPLGTGRDYIQVEGLASYGDYLVVNVTHKDPSNEQPPAAVALLAFNSSTGEVGNVLAVYQGDVPGISSPDALEGVKLWGGGPVRIFDLGGGVARV